MEVLHIRKGFFFYTLVRLIEVVELPWDEYLTALEAGDFDLYFGEIRLTADWDLTDLLSIGAPLNYGGERAFSFTH